MIITVREALFGWLGMCLASGITASFLVPSDRGAGRQLAAAAMKALTLALVLAAAADAARWILTGGILWPVAGQVPLPASAFKLAVFWLVAVGIVADVAWRTVREIRRHWRLRGMADMYRQDDARRAQSR